jgi:hypothetical protein
VQTDAATLQLETSVADLELETDATALEDETKVISYVPSIEPVPLLDDSGASHFSRSEMITFVRISNLSLRFEFLT